MSVKWWGWKHPHQKGSWWGFGCHCSCRKAVTARILLISSWSRPTKPQSSKVYPPFPSSVDWRITVWQMYPQVQLYYSPGSPVSSGPPGSPVCSLFTSFTCMFTWFTCVLRFTCIFTWFTCVLRCTCMRSTLATVSCKPGSRRPRRKREEKSVLSWRKMFLCHQHLLMVQEH